MKPNLLLLIAFIIFPNLALAKITDLRPNGPLKTRTQNPLYLQFLGLPMESPQTLNRNQFEMQLDTTFSNVFEVNLGTNTSIMLDMEIWRTEFSFLYGLTKNIDVKIEVPFISNGSGFLDGFIQGFHNAFGLPNGGRDLLPHNQFIFNVSQNGKTLLDHDSIAFGLSDIIVRFKYLISGDWKLPFKLAIAPHFKIPTGRSSRGISSGHFDFGLSLLAQKSLKRFHFTTNLGYVFLGPHAQLDPLIKVGFFQFGQSIEFQIIDGLAIITQISGNTSVFKDVDAPDLKKIVLDLNIGFAGHFPIKKSLFDEFFYQWSFSEDVMSSGPSVDFSLLFLVGVRY